MLHQRLIALPLVVLLFGSILPQTSVAADLLGTIVDADDGRRIAARVYLRSADGKFHHVQCISPGAAAPYRKARGKQSVEVHTAITAHPFRATLPAGDYQLTVERGKEYFADTRQLTLRDDEPTKVLVKLRRWIRMADHGWYSGETHVHRTLDELPTAMQAEQLNVAFPLTHWVTRSHTPPTHSDRNLDPQAKPELIHVGPDQVIYPLNTEYEIFTVGGRRHTLGAVFAINHQKPLELGTPPVAPIAAEVRRQGGLLELDKHNWPWSMMLPPVMKVDLYELTNNHIWRTNFAFQEFGEAPAPYMRAETHPDGGVTERGWIQFTFENYYALLNCGLKMKPTAGCASGVHPVPLGFGRVYVYQPDRFEYHDWVRGLGAGRSFVTTGPMLHVSFNGKMAHQEERFERPTEVRLRGWITSPDPLTAIEIIQDGRVVRRIDAQAEKTAKGAWHVKLEQSIPVSHTGWVAVRCFSKTPEGRPRFAHSAPYHVTIGETQLAPTAAQRTYLIERVETEIQRNTGVLSEAELAEFQQALDFYRRQPIRSE